MIHNAFAHILLLTIMKKSFQVVAVEAHLACFSSLLSALDIYLTCSVICYAVQYCHFSVILSFHGRHASFCQYDRSKYLQEHSTHIFQQTISERDYFGNACYSAKE